MEVTTYAKFEGISEEIKRLLSRASDSVRICVAWLSFDLYRPILLDLLSRDVDVYLIVNHDEKNEIEEIRKIAGLNFKPLMMRVRSKLMHNKFCIIDDRIVVTGSYNWSENAEGHFENIVIIKEDLSLVKKFRHEFEDLYEYHTHQVDFEKCHCRSILFKLAIFGYEGGRHNDSTVGVWAVCARNNHVKFLGSRDEQYLHAQLRLTDDDDDEFEINLRESDAKVWDMRRAFDAERVHRRRIQSYFSSRYIADVHGIGWVVCTNSGEYYKGYADSPEFEVSIPFRDAYFRKVIPSVLGEHDGEVDKIVDMHKPAV